MERIEDLKNKYETNQKRVLESLREVGLENVDQAIIDRLVILEERSSFNYDSRMIERGLKNLLSLLEQQETTETGLVISSQQKQEAFGAAILHDIGKTGPANATDKQQQAVVDLYAMEDVKKGSQTVDEVVQTHFTFEPKKAEYMLMDLKACGVETDMTMREFWDKHSWWTFDILEKYSQGLSQRLKVIAATHHIDRGINPYNLSEEEIPIESNVIGLMEYYIESLEGRALMVIDKYQAAIRRGKLSHAEALERTRKILGEKYERDPLIQKILNGLDTLGKEGRIFN